MTLGIAALGLRARTGRAAAVAVASTSAGPVVLARWAIQLIPDEAPRQVFHAAAGLGAGDAEQLVGRVSAAVAEQGVRAVGELLAELRASGHQVSGLGLGIGRKRYSDGRPAAAILASHAAMHGAEGELYRDALLEAGGRHGLLVRAVVEKEAYQHGAAALELSPDELRRRLTGLGRPLGAPWAEDQKLATLYALLVLCG